ALLMPVRRQIVAAPSRWVTEIEALLEAASSPAGGAQRLSVDHADVLKSLREAPNGPGQAAIIAGGAALSHPQASVLISMLQALAASLGVRFGVIAQGANAVGGALVGATPTLGGPNAANLFNETHAAYLLLQLEPALDLAAAPAAVAILQQARDISGVISLTAYRSAAESVSSLMLPVSPFAETSGTFVNLEGRVQSFQACVPPLGQSRPGWKVLRVLGNLLDLNGFDQDSSEDVLKELLPSARSGEVLSDLQPLCAPIAAGLDPAPSSSGGFERLGEPSIYKSDPIVRRAASLSESRISAQPRVAIHPEDLASLGASADMLLNLEVDGRSAQLLPVVDPSLARGVVLIPMGHPETANINGVGGRVQISIARHLAAVEA
ncbi:MAG: molybdopterin-dependent oxidoreductase, partial [Burkholderiaceae bacterium]|nr:molybdopterin-dependent oxidoreductase [Burkholderiaceae bacterium]